MKRARLLWLLLIAPILIAAVLYRSNQYPKGYYGSPLGIKVELAANFGEVRTDHYHMGLDIRTNGKENLPVYATADGYISRVTIEEGSFGKAIYITHPNGTMSVYGHLNKFMPALEDIVRTKQYKDERWEQDIHFTNTDLPVWKGMLVAYSGNTGASEGPHLHFEVRDVHTGNNLNPLQNGFGLKDNIAPVVHVLVRCYKKYIPNCGYTYYFKQQR
jgi:murein DD-endopeptidase MepM/ murein hydrolase activator NlpD